MSRKDDFMNISIRKHIIDNFKDCNKDDIKSSILSSVGDSDEITLPGLGVFFEILWNDSSDNEKQHFLDVLEKNLSKKNA